MSLRILMLFSRLNFRILVVPESSYLKSGEVHRWDEFWIAQRWRRCHLSIYQSRTFYHPRRIFPLLTVFMMTVEIVTPNAERWWIFLLDFFLQVRVLSLYSRQIEQSDTWYLVIYLYPLFVVPDVHSEILGPLFFLLISIWVSFDKFCRTTKW